MPSLHRPTGLVVRRSLGAAAALVLLTGATACGGDDGSGVTQLEGECPSGSASGGSASGGAESGGSASGDSASAGSASC